MHKIKVRVEVHLHRMILAESRNFGQRESRIESASSFELANEPLSKTTILFIGVYPLCISYLSNPSHYMLCILSLL
jgi:hypothetical protein